MSFESVQEMFSRMAAEFGPQVAVDRAGQRVTYANLEAESNRLANFLLEGGAGKGTMVGLLADNLAQISQRVDRFTQKTESQVGNFSEQGLFELQRLVRETRSAAREFRELSQTLKENPSQILYQPADSGVTIAR